MVVFSSFLKYKAHIGSSIKNTILLTTWFLYKLRTPLWIINVFKTILFIKIIYRFLRFIVNNSLPLWFINLEVTKELLFKHYANLCGEFYCTKLWIRGLLSNYKSIQESINKFILKKYIAKVTVKSFFVNYWAATRYTWPRGIFISNIKSNYVIAKEAGHINLPIIAIVDTNVKNFLFNLPIPANSDSNESFCFIINIISRQILLMKYKKLLNWYTLFKLRKSQDLNKFVNLYEKVRQEEFSDILKKRVGSAISLNSCKKFKVNMKILKTPIKLDKSERNINMNLITILNFRYEVIKKALVFSYFFKNAILKLRLKASISYRNNIKNYIKYSKMSSLYLTKKNKIYKQRIFNNFMPLHFSYILYNFKLSKIFYETFRRRFLVDASNVISAKHWLTFKQRLNRARYSKKLMVNYYWLVPFF